MKSRYIFPWEGYSRKDIAKEFRILNMLIKEMAIFGRISKSF
jgi:hypothetical protein